MTGYGERFINQFSVFQIWNYDANLAVKDNVLEKIHSLVPEVQFLAEFYKPHQTHAAFEGKRTAGIEKKARNHSGAGVAR